MEEKTMSFPVINLVRTGENIKRIAKENGYSADKIRDVLGISDRSNIYKWFRGEVLPAVDNRTDANSMKIFRAFVDAMMKAMMK